MRYRLAAVVLSLILAACAAKPEVCRVVKHHDRFGMPIEVSVCNSCFFEEKNRRGETTSFAGYADLPNKTIYLCGKDDVPLPHELAHFAGMRHDRWVDQKGLHCARVIDAGHDTGYRVGSTICTIGRGDWSED